jgi:molybdopterin molybdotransferase
MTDGANAGGVLKDDCFLTGSERMRHAEAIALLRERLAPVAKAETVPLHLAASRICAQDILSPRPVPASDNSAVDGYAFRAADHAACCGSFRIAGRIAAGDRMDDELPAGCAVRIFTGAPMPAGADTVAMQEDCRATETGVAIPAGLKHGANRRKAGEDLKEGDIIVARGTRLRPQDLAAAASAGHEKVRAYRPLRIGLVSSGNELRRPGSPLGQGEVYDANLYLLGSMISALPAELTDFGIVRDNARETREVLRLAASTCAAIVTSGGASMGEEDHMGKVLAELGNRHMWQIAVKPGRPMGFGQIGGVPVFGLPGNPVAAFVCFLLYVRPALQLLGGGEFHEPARYLVPAGFSISKKPGRREFWRGWIEPAADGSQRAMKFARDGSGLISGLRQATGLIEIGEDVVEVREGEPVAFLPFGEFGIS